VRSSFKGQTPREAAWNVATRVLPCLIWMQHYDVKKQLLRDIAAGVAVTFLIIPQGLSYAGIAGLPTIRPLCVPCHLAYQARWLSNFSPMSLFGSVQLD
jgi:MFS superfamily sulfate permease-like transporter